MTEPRSVRLALCAAVVSLLPAACATVPVQQVTALGTVPAAGPYEVVRPDKAAAPHPAVAGLETCLQGAGLAPGQPAAWLAQAAYTVRPARAALLHGDEEAPRVRIGRKRDREELVLTLTDRTSGILLWRGAVQRVLGKREAPGDGTALVAPLCAAFRGAPAATSR